MSNSNVNQQAIQIVFPDNMELRKVKKRKRKSVSSSKKKDLINELKELLRDYDMVINEAKEKKIELPKELGQLPTDIKDMKSIKQLEIIIDELKQKIMKIEQLIKSHGVNNRASELFGVAPRPLGSGAFPQMISQPQMVQPQIIEPQIIPRQPVVPIQPQSDPGEALDKLEAELLSQLDPNAQSTKDIIAQINERKRQQQQNQQDPRSRPLPSTPIDNRPLPPTPIDNRPLPPTPVEATDSDLEIEQAQGVKIGYSGKRFDIRAPKGWLDLNESFRRYAENIQFDAQQLRPGEYHIDTAKLNDLVKYRNAILSDYDKWLDDLTPNQRQFLDNSQILRVANQQMFQGLNESPGQLLRIILTAQGQKNLKLTEGDESPEIEQIFKKKGLDKTGEMHLSILKDMKTAFEEELKTVKSPKYKPKNRQELIDRQTRAENELSVIIRERDRLSLEDQVGTIDDYEEVEVVYQELQELYNRLIDDTAPEPIYVGTPRPPSDIPVDFPVQPIQQIDPVVVIGKGDAGYSNLDIRTLIKYVDNPKQKWGKKEQESYDRLFNEMYGDAPVVSGKRIVIRNYIQEYLKQNPVAD